MLIQPETNKKVSQDLQGIFGASENEKNGVDIVKTKKKRSSDNTHPLFMADTSKNEQATHAIVHGNDKTLAPKAQKKQKRNAADPDDDEEADNENGMRAFIST